LKVTTETKEEHGQIEHDSSGREPFQLPEEDDDPPKPRSFLQDAPRAGAWRIAALSGLSLCVASAARWQHIWNGASSADKVFGKGEWWTLLSALFVHADLNHLSHNLPIFLIFAFLLYGYFNWIAFPVLCLLIGVASNLMTIWYYGKSMQLLGASGMIYGMQSLWLCLYLRYEVRFSWSARLLRSVGFVLLMLVPRQYEENVSYAAHGFGFLCGIMAFLLYLGFAKKHPTPS
jgi:rhomboid protease GluP